MRLELEPFGIKVIDLKSGFVKSNLIDNRSKGAPITLPKGSIYEPARDLVEMTLRGDRYRGKGSPADEWAKGVVGDLLGRNPPQVIWRGESAWTAWLGSVMPRGWLDGTVKKLSGMEEVEKMVRK